MSQTSHSNYLRLSIMMFLQFFIWGAFFVPMGGYLGTVFSDVNNLNSFIGSSYATHNWAAIISPLFIGLIADRFFNAEKVNGILHILGAGLLWWASEVTESGLFFWVLLGYFLCYMPTLALVNAITFSNVSNTEEDFPKIRLWGTIGWIVAGLVVAQTFFGIFPLPVLPGVEDAGKTSIPMKIGSVLSLIYGFYSFTLPATPPSGKGKPASITKMLGLDALRLFKNPAYAVFAICSFTICIPLAFYYARTYEFTSSMAFADKTAGIMALGQVSEILFMALVPFFLRKLGVKWMLLVGMLAWVTRYAVFGLAPSAPAMLVFGIVLHGICYDFFFVTGQLYTDRKAPKEIRTSAQSLIGLLTYGAGMLVGNYVLGWWGDKIKLDPTTKDGWLAGAKEFWLLPAGVALAVAAIFFVAFWDKSGDKEDTA